MIRRNIKLVLLLLLPLFMARGVLPAGLMLTFDDGPQLVFCPGQGQVIAGEHAVHQAAEHHHGHHEGHSHPGGHDAYDSSSCPFALAAVAAPPVVAANVTAAVDVTCESIAFSPVAAITAHAVYAHPIRGPPVFS